MDDILNRKHYLAGASVLLLLGACGGGGEPSTLAAEPGIVRRAELSASNPLDTPVPPGATRMIRFSRYPSSGGGTTSEHAEDVVSHFDALRIPINIVHCDWHAERTNDILSVAWLMVLDVHNSGLEAARREHFIELTPENLGFFVPKDYTCSTDRKPGMAVSQRIHRYARRVYPHLFAGFGFPNFYQQYRYRLYTATNNYLGLDGNEVYVHNGRDWNFLHVGNVKDFIPTIDGIPAAASAPAR